MKKEKRTHSCVVHSEKSEIYHFFLSLPYPLLAFQEWFYKNRPFWPLDMPVVICSCCSPICKGHNNMCCKFEGFLVQRVESGGPSGLLSKAFKGDLCSKVPFCYLSAVQTLETNSWFRITFLLVVGLVLY